MKIKIGAKYMAMKIVMKNQHESCRKRVAKRILKLNTYVVTEKLMNTADADQDVRRK